MPDAPQARPYHTVRVHRRHSTAATSLHGMDLNHIETAIVSGGGHTVMTVGDLRAACNKERAGARIIEDITRQLAAVGIHHVPTALPTDSARQVFLYRPAEQVTPLLALALAEKANSGNPAAADEAVRGLDLIVPAMAYRAADEPAAS